MTQRVWVRPHTTWDTYRLCRGLRERGLTQVVSDRSPWPHCPRLLAPHEMTSSGVMATVCWSLHKSSNHWTGAAVVHALHLASCCGAARQGCWLPSGLLLPAFARLPAEQRRVVAPCHGAAKLLAARRLSSQCSFQQAVFDRPCRTSSVQLELFYQV